jgi:hypothetical protein
VPVPVPVVVVRFHQMWNSLRGWHASGRSTTRIVPRSRSTHAWIVTLATFTVSFVFEFEFSCAPATLAAPATIVPTTAPKTIDFIPASRI